jgi:hypothetical protein
MTKCADCGEHFQRFPLRFGGHVELVPDPEGTWSVTRSGLAVHAVAAGAKAYERHPCTRIEPADLGDRVRARDGG